MTSNRRDFLTSLGASLGALPFLTNDLHAGPIWSNDREAALLSSNETPAPFLSDELVEAARRSQRSLILVWLDGGLSHLDSFDAKPEAAVDIRGELPTRRTPIDDVFFGEALERLAALVPKCTLIRSLTSGEGNHDRGTHYMLTGHRPSPVLRYPSLGSWLGHDVGSDRGHAVEEQAGDRVSRDSSSSSEALPDYIAIPDVPPSGRQGFLPASRLPFEIGQAPNQRGFRVRNLTRDPARARARKLLDLKNRLGSAAASEAERTLADLQRRSRALVESDEAREAFALERETPQLRQRFGRGSLGQSCLLARRLVERGVRVVLVRDRGWDMHQNIVRRMTYGFPPKLPALDQAVSALIEDLERSGLGERVLVAVASEFGRTPRVNPAGGRDHWPRAHSSLLYGAGVKRGAIVGATDVRGEEPSERPVSPAEFVATLIAALRADPKTELRTPDGRPIGVVEHDAKPVREALA